VTRKQDDEPRMVVYCLVPEALADTLIAPLRAHFAGREDVTVIVDRRRRRHLPPRERRRPAVPRQLAPALAPELASYAKDLRWEQRLRPVRRLLQDAERDELLELIAGGDDDAQAELYWRYANRVWTRLASRRVREFELDAAARETFGRLFDGIVRGDVGGRSFDASVTRVADAVARDHAASR
jgi:hypothetical protein